MSPAVGAAKPVAASGASMPARATSGAGRHRCGCVDPRDSERWRRRRHRQPGARAGRRWRVDAVLLVDDAEQVGCASSIDSDEPRNSRPSGPQREMEDLERALLRVAVQVDQQVAAGDQIEPRERRVLEQVVRGEQHQSRAARAARGSRDGSLTKKRAQPLLAHVGRDGLGIDAASRAARIASSSRSVGEDLDGRAALERARVLAAAASPSNTPPRRWRTPAPRRAPRRLGPCPRTAPGCASRAPSNASRSRKKLVTRDQQVLEQRAGLARVGAQERQVGRQVARRR